ncbi:retrovirus-like pol polyprotein [Lasius niger]|uniref:Retrovirus-like pol polyprotein n=1 Tax=Lasius niger TaxID=67767 RepID=A0A0J7K5Z0_LASNI|nr:retrovirus-like pol polyprotein [Lasius niger]
MPSAFIIPEEQYEQPYQDYLSNLFTTLKDSQELARGNLIRSKEKSKRYYDKKVNEKRIKIGDRVYLIKEPSRGKMDDQYTGPHRVLEILPKNNIKINFKGKPRVVHADKLKIAKTGIG